LDKKYIVLDDFAPLSYQQHLEEVFYHQLQGPMWSFGTATTGGNEENIFKPFVSDFEVSEGPQLICVAFADNQIVHQTWFDLRPLLWFLEMKLPSIKINGTERCKVNLNPLNETWKDRISTPHSDTPTYSKNRYTLIYYIKDSDGDTVLFDQKYESFKKNKVSLTVCGRIAPKKGRAILFPSDLLHSGTNPVDHDCRIVVNLVFETAQPIVFDELV
jgi:hypothetical protein